MLRKHFLLVLFCCGVLLSAKAQQSTEEPAVRACLEKMNLFDYMKQLKTTGDWKIEN